MKPRLRDIYPYHSQQTMKSYLAASGWKVIACRAPRVGEIFIKSPQGTAERCYNKFSEDTYRLIVQSIDAEIPF